jgi:hypothetical protein
MTEDKYVVTKPNFRFYLVCCINIKIVNFPNVNMNVFWDTVPYSLVKTDHRSGGAYSLHHQDDALATVLS